MKKVLLAYATNSGSTKEIAEFVASKLSANTIVDVKELSRIESLDGYDAVVIGAPMILGIHSDARKFLSRHQKMLTTIPYACFFTAMNVTRQGSYGNEYFSIRVDSNVEQEPKRQDKFSIKEAYAKVDNYLSPITGVLRKAPPKNVAFFAGKLEMYRLKLIQALFVMVIIQVKPGDLRNWPFIESWTSQTFADLGLMDS